MLTDKEIAALERRDKPYKRFDSGGLYVEVSPSGLVSWRLRYTFGRSTGVLTLGRWPKLSIAKARQRQTEIEQLVTEGVDPREELLREKRTGRNTFEVQAREWLATQAPGWTERYTGQVTRNLERSVFGFRVREGRREFGRMILDDIDASDVLEVVRAIEARGALDIAADVLMWVGKVFSYAIALKRAKRNPAIDVKQALTKRTRTSFAAIPAQELPELFRRLHDSPVDEQTQLGLRLMARLVPRTVELSEALWSEVDWSRSLMLISQVRMKDERANRKAFGPYLIPLAPSSLALLERLRQLTSHSAFLFPGRDGPHTTISNGTWLMALKRLGYAHQHTVHGFRTTFSTYWNEVDTEKWERIVDRQLDHVPRNKVSAAYNRAQYLTQRVELMNLWADVVDKAERAGGFRDLPMLDRAAPRKPRDKAATV